MKESKFNDVVSKLLGEKLKFLKDEDRSLNLTSCVEAYMKIFETLADLFKTSNVQLSNESVNYMAQQYYDAVLVNNTQELDPNIFTQRAKLENIETRELALIAVMWSGTEFAIPVIQAVKQRS